MWLRTKLLVSCPPPPPPATPPSLGIPASDSPLSEVYGNYIRTSLKATTLLGFMLASNMCEECEHCYSSVTFNFGI